jgi:hypothetical protein
MTKEDKRRTLSERLQELLETLRETLSPRQPAPVPIPMRDLLRRR